MVAEAAATHQDGTISLLRAGINRVWKPEPPVPLNGAVVIRLDAAPSESGQHNFEVRLMDDDGRDVAPRIDGNMQVPTGGGTTHVVINFHVSFPKFGRYTFSVNVDRVVYQTWTIEASSPPPPPKPNT